MLWTCSRWQHRGKHQRVSTVHITHSARAPTEEHLNLRPEKALKAVTPIVTFVTSYREDDARNELPTYISIDERLTCSWFANIKGTGGLPCCCCFLANRSPGGDGPFNAQPYKLVAGQDHTASLILPGLPCWLMRCSMPAFRRKPLGLAKWVTVVLVAKTLAPLLQIAGLERHSLPVIALLLSTWPLPSLSPPGVWRDGIRFWPCAGPTTGGERNITT